MRYFNAITKSGTVVVSAKDGRIELTIPAPVFEKSRLTTLSPNQRVKVRLVSGPDGGMSLDSLELGPPRSDHATVAAEARRVGVIPANPQLALLERQRAMREQFPGW